MRQGAAERLVADLVTARGTRVPARRQNLKLSRRRTRSKPIFRTHMIVTPTPLPGVLVVEPKIFGDSRGFFLETWHAERYREAGIAASFVQDNVSFSRRGVLRGLHFQRPNDQAKLVAVLEGEVFDVAIDVRVGSPHFGKSTSVVLSGENKRQIFIPEGFAHGFCVLSESADVFYKCSDFYHPGDERAVLWNDQIGSAHV
jgi:dTDP-4-dehydrorhamnose 3,5-epimerase